MDSHLVLENELDATGEARLFQQMRHFWQPVMYAAELGSQPCPAQVLGEQLVVVRMGSEVCVFPDLCVHRGTALSLGRVEGEELRCAYHGWTYGADGACTSIPARFGMNIPARARLRKFRAAEACGLIWVCLDGEPRHPLPQFPELEDSTYRVVTVPAYDWKCNFARRVENYVDFAHFAWVHDGILGDHNHPEVPDHDVWWEGPELRLRVAMEEPTTNTKNQPVAGEAQTLITRKSYRMFVPNAIWLQHQIAGDNYFVLFMATCPIAPNRTRTFTFNARNYDFNVDDQKYVDYQELIVGQDQPITESQRPEELPVDLSAELHIRGVDKVSVEYRKWLISVANGASAR